MQVARKKKRQSEDIRPQWVILRLANKSFSQPMCNVRALRFLFCFFLLYFWSLWENVVSSRENFSLRSPLLPWQYCAVLVWERRPSSAAV